MPIRPNRLFVSLLPVCRRLPPSPLLCFRPSRGLTSQKNGTPKTNSTITSALASLKVVYCVLRQSMRLVSVVRDSGDAKDDGKYAPLRAARTLPTQLLSRSLVLQRMFRRATTCEPQTTPTTIISFSQSSNMRIHTEHRHSVLELATALRVCKGSAIRRVQFEAEHPHAGSGVLVMVII